MRKRETKRAFPKLLSCLLAAALLTTIVPLGAVTVSAAGTPTALNIADGSIVIGSSSLTVGGVTQTPNKDNSYSITGSSTANNIHVTGGTVTIELDNVNLNSGRSFYLDPGVNVTLLLSGSNTVESSGDWAGIEVPQGSSLTIGKANSSDSDNDDVLVAKADGSSGASAGIGGSGSGTGNGETCGTVLITGGSVQATGGYMGGAGIGGGLGANTDGGAGGAVTISGGAVKADGSPGSAGIGGGGGLRNGGSGGSVTITGGTVTAIGGVGGIGMGGGSAMNGTGGGAGTIKITGGSINADIQGTPTNGSANGNSPLFLTTVSLPSVNMVTSVTALVTGTDYYGVNSLSTDSSGKLYLWLPSGAIVTAAETAALHYPGSISAGTAGTLGTATPRPAVTSVSVPASGVYGAGKNMDFVVNFDQAVTVNTAGGTPYLPLTVGGSTVKTVYLSGSGTSALTFRYTVAPNDSDTDGVALGSAITLDGGTIQSAQGANAQLVCHNVASTSNVLVDAIAPTVTTVTPSGTDVSVGTASLSVTFSKAMDAMFTGIVTLNNAPLTNPLWDTDHKTVTYTLSGLSYHTGYSVAIFGFRDTGNNMMLTYTCPSFITAPKNLTDAMVADIAAQTYTGSAIEPGITVADGSTTLLQGTDYTVSYSANTAAGTAAATVTGIGQYSGQVLKNFIINPKAIALTLTASPRDGANAGSDVTLTAAVTGAVNLPKGTVTFRDGGMVIAQDVPITGGSNDSYSAQAIWNNVSDGSHNITAEYILASSGENYVCSVAATLSNYNITKQNQTGFNFSAPVISKTYGDADFTAIASGGQGSGTVTYASNDTSIATVDANTGTVHIEKAGVVVITASKAADSNYNAATATVTVTVGKASTSITALPAAGNITVVGKLSSSMLTGGAGSADGTFSWTNPDTVVTKTGSYEVTFTPKDADDYFPCTGEVQVTVNPTVINSSSTVSLDLSGVTLPSGVTSVLLDSSQPDTGSTEYTAVFKRISGDAALGNLKNLVLYDLKLLDQNGNPIENFTGKIKVKVKIPSGMSGDLHIYWYDSTNNRLVDMDATQEDGYLIFYTTHFNFYAIAQLGASSSPVSNPKTGPGNWPLISWVVLGGSAVAGIICVKRWKVFRRKTKLMKASELSR